MICDRLPPIQYFYAASLAEVCGLIKLNDACVDQVGFDAGDGVKSFVLANSQTPAIQQIYMETNVNVTGRWMFRVDLEEILSDTPTSSTGKGSVTSRSLQ